MKTLTALALVAFTALSFSAQAVEVKAAEKLAKKSNCLKCHAISKKKDGPSYKEIAEKYKGDSEAEQKLFTHVTSSPKVEVNGKEETHEKVKSDDEAAIKNLVQWILSR
jgi:cytochrome c